MKISDAKIENNRYYNFMIKDNNLIINHDENLYNDYTKEKFEDQYLKLRYNPTYMKEMVNN